MIGTTELLLILCLALLFFGGKKLPELARNLGRGAKEFRKACQGTEEDTKSKKNDDDLRNS